MKSPLVALTILMSSFLLTACGSTSAGLTAKATLEPTTDREISGNIMFHQLDEGKVRVSGSIFGLNADQEHGFHIHETGDCSESGDAAGGHFHHEGHHEHGLRESGDLPNVKADENGIGQINYKSSSISLEEGDLSVVGRAIVLHEHEDDYSQDETTAGGRIACGIIKKQ